MFKKQAKEMLYRILTEPIGHARFDDDYYLQKITELQIEALLNCSLIHIDEAYTRKCRKCGHAIIINEDTFLVTDFCCNCNELAEWENIK